MSGAEVGFFSLSPANIHWIKAKKSNKSRMVLKLMSMPQRLLATILIVNNFVNMGVVIISTFLTASMVDFKTNPLLGFVIQVVLVTFIILLIGEIMPKVYSSNKPINFCMSVAYPIYFLLKTLYPFSSLLMNSTNYINKYFMSKKQNISLDDLSHAIDLTSINVPDEKKILKGIANFGSIEVNEIMKSRLDVLAISSTVNFKKLMSIIVESGYSRIPVFQETFDNVIGILYIKDLLPFIDKDENFKWVTLIRKPYFVPETKKINDLLVEFQAKKIHMAVVIDEYGGTCGLVTMEDVLEEILGEISDEFDEDESIFTKLDESNYLFEGKTLLNDFCKIMRCNDDLFDNVKGDAQTLAGLILEMKGEIPKKNDSITFQQFQFTIKIVDNRRIKQIHVAINQ